MERDHDLERALTLKQAAEILGVSYYTLFRRRHQIAFRIPGVRVWRVWPSTIAALSKKRSNLIRLSLRHGQEKRQCLFAKEKAQLTGGLISQRQAAKELDSLLAPHAEKKRKNSTTD